MWNRKASIHRFFKRWAYFGLVSGACAWGMLLDLACTRSSSVPVGPKDVLTEYVSRSFSVHVPEDKLKLAELLTGEVKDRLASWSDDQFRAAFIDSKREFIQLSFRGSESISPSEVQVTYELVYLDRSKNKRGEDREIKVTDRKLCRMLLVDQKWFIADVKNIHEFLEFKNELSLP
ncbi:MAG: hypothetical protein ACO3A2_11735 [Bdellovibrionia bacterium]